jgi:hypothetical protein
MGGNGWSGENSVLRKYTVALDKFERFGLK